MRLIKSRFLISHTTPYKLKHFCENEANAGSGIERWLKYKIKCAFNIKLFTLEQKRHLKCRHSEKSHKMNGDFVVGPRTYDEIFECIGY